ncbi:hypothetical protein CAPTEDRAFT_211484 [Capitella teleta]|uniref:Phytanoyl-CoA hydroxylase-interacting protein-like C-terminal domain-containing protein n=1 Tax=Capitella teleta TaxID=283909 RepID=R7UBU5_CAPTE|nr:hypothetical protein CAPTEDRAFT_211484 [Capitella teleta]|eukprot:ELU03429.1 hypothetical protein CAPTEDRAFT_211484 [Capitella teleta]
MHSKEQLFLLQNKALTYAKRKGRKYRKIKWFYRDKSLEYMTEAVEADNMAVYAKDENGDPQSPINGRLHGLHFQVNVYFRSGKPMPFSVFGDTRLHIDADHLWSLCPNLYFADFYCLQKQIHHVTIVMTRPRSKADRFCTKHLPPLDAEKNPFLRRRLDVNGKTCFKVLNNGIWVEAFFTEDVNMALAVAHGKELESVNQRGRRKGPRPKDTSCPHCNI